ncbi:MAG TPA: tRNA lysidine(34) synthetase TilS [Gemmatimonadales bacterium]|nr:tRNA lysidine(34) synthetase TilS [Gemmatimonadales bacterium]
MSLAIRFADHLATLGIERGTGALVAVSGGPDSVALLSLLAETSDLHGLACTVGHIDHGIAAASEEVGQRVRRLAEALGIPFRAARLRLGADASETLARERRYAALGRLRRSAGARFLFTAHHADDQIETVLMRALRGSGPAGLAGMAARRGTVVRPLLPFRRQELAEYIRERGLEAWDDPANREPRHLRSWLRHQILPELRGRLPDTDQRILDLAAHAAADRAAWDQALDQWPGLDARSETDGISVAVSPLEGYDCPLRLALLQAAARRVGLSLGPRRADRLLELFAAGRSGASVPLGGEWTAERTFDRIRLIRAPAPVALGSAALEGPAGELRWGRWLLRWRTEPAPGRQLRTGNTAWIVPGPLQVRGWAAGDRIRPLGGAGRRLAVKCFQEARIPRSERNRWPVLAVDDVMVWVPGVCRSDALLPLAGTESLRVDATDR